MMKYISYLLITTYIGSCYCTLNSVVMTMMCRDEDVNLRANLPLWLTTIDYFVFLLDERNSDSSVSTIQSILGKAEKNFVIQSYKFEGFGAARTLSLKTAWEYFSNASHVLIADPDWKPDTNTLNLSELDHTADVFRFTAYDRNGITRRRMDWFLRNKQGLAMRYSLHEVLDIGYYSVKDINWIVHEIEQMGSWHTTVGHGNSRTSKRYAFDLNLLYKDLAQYDHDPHVHYYLGITLHAYAETLMVETGSFPHEIVSQAKTFLEKRVYSVYDDEFIEERWACMFILGTLHASLAPNYVSAVKWFSLCRDYNPKQAECSVALANLYLQHGLFQQAFEEIEKVLKMELEERLMLNMIRTRQCDVPEVAARIILIKGRNGQFLFSEFKYMLALIHMLENPLCIYDTKPLLKEAQSILLLNGVLNTVDDIFGDKTKVCSSSDVQMFIRQRKYTIHPCDQLANQIQLEQLCGIYFATLPPAVEEYQINTDYKKFIGSAIPIDIIHHIYGGDKSKIFGRTMISPYRILFAQFFQPEMVENLIGFFQSERFSAFHITIVSDNSGVIDFVKSKFASCAAFISIDNSKIEFVGTSLVEFLRKAQIIRSKYDFIEYNGGLSIDENSSENLAGFRNILSPTGVIGVTYFSSNRHFDILKSHISLLNKTVLLPFSIESTRYVRQYLKLNKLDFMASDDQLLTFLGGEPINRKYPNDKLGNVVPSVRWRGYTKNQISDILGDAKLFAGAWVPTAYSNPYDEIAHYNVQIFRSLGLPESAFLHDIFTSFRVTMYVTRDENRVHTSRFRLSSSHFFNEDISKTIVVLDRLGQFGVTFKPLEDLAMSGMSGKFGFTPFFSQAYFGLDYVSAPVVSTALAQLSSKPTLYDLLTVCKEFNLKSSEKLDERNTVDKLVSALSYLEKINAIGFSCNSRCDLVASVDNVLEFDGILRCAFPKLLLHNQLLFGGVWVEIGEFQGSFFKFVADSVSKDVSHILYSPSSSLIEIVDLNVVSYELHDGVPLDFISTNLPPINMVLIDRHFSFSKLWWDKMKHRITNGCIVICFHENCNDNSMVAEIGRAMSVRTITAASTCSLNKKILGLEIINNPFLNKMRDSITNNFIQRKLMQELGLEESVLDETIEPNCAKLVPLVLSEPGQNDKKSTELNKKLQNLMGVLGVNIEKLELYLGLQSKNSTNEQRLENIKEDNGMTTTQDDESIGDIDNAELASFVSDANQVKLPGKLCTILDLKSSFRKPECISALAKKNGMVNCTQRKPIKRRTSAIYMTSMRKLRFDLLQIQYLLSSNLIENDSVLKFIDNHESIFEDFSDGGTSTSHRVMKLVVDSKHQSPLYLNRALYLATDFESRRPLLHWGAIKQLKSIVHGQHDKDFVVVDVVMPMAVLHNVTTLFRTSTIWYDITNGAAFVSHHDDSLYFSAVAAFSQQLALALSTPAYSLRVVKYYAVALLSDDSFHSASAYGNRNEVVAILWLDSDVDDRQTYLQLIDSQSIECLFRQGVSIYPSVHPDFLSKGGDLDINLTERCDTYPPEMIPYRPNRLVVLYSRSPFSFKSTSSVSTVTKFSEAKFAIVITYEKV